MTLKDRLRPFFLFVVGGVINTAVSYAAYLFLERFIGYRVAYFLAYVVGIFFSYFFTSIIVFRRRIGWRSFFSFPLVYVMQYVCGGIFLELFVQNFGVNKLYAPLLVAVLMLPVTFLLSKLVLKFTSRRMDAE